jgi:hypothetical protein
MSVLSNTALSYLPLYPADTILASARFTLYDVLTGEAVSSAEANTRGFVFSPANLRQQAVIAESRRALQFLYDPRNKPGLAGIMSEVPVK